MSFYCVLCGNSSFTSDFDDKAATIKALKICSRCVRLLVNIMGTDEINDLTKKQLNALRADMQAHATGLQSVYNEFEKLNKKIKLQESDDCEDEETIIFNEQDSFNFYNEHQMDDVYLSMVEKMSYLRKSIDESIGYLKITYTYTKDECDDH